MRPRVNGTELLSRQSKVMPGGQTEPAGSRRIRTPEDREPLPAARKYTERTDTSRHPGTMIWMFGPDTKCRTVSKAWLKFRGRTVEQERGEGWLEGVHQDDRERCTQVLRSAFLLRQ